MSRDHDILTTLRTLDPADHHADPRGTRARADLARILGTAPDRGREVPLPAAGGTAPRRRVPTVRRLALAGAAVAAITTAVVALPSVTGGDSAFATWTPTPQAMSAADREAAAEACREQQQDGPAGEYGDRLGAAAPVIVESRGVWTTVVLAGADGFSALCVTDGSPQLFDSWIGSVGAAGGRTAPGPRELAATDLGAGSVGGNPVSLAAGVAGSDVIAIAYDSQARGQVVATVSQGHFAFWLPGDELDDASSDGVDVAVTYRDGTTATTRLDL